MDPQRLLNGPCVVCVGVKKSFGWEVKRPQGSKTSPVTSTEPFYTKMTMTTEGLPGIPLFLFCRLALFVFCVCVHLQATNPTMLSCHCVIVEKKLYQNTTEGNDLFS